MKACLSGVCFSVVQEGCPLAVLRSRICAFRAGAAGVIPARGTSILHSVGEKMVQNGNQNWSRVAAGTGTLEFIEKTVKCRSPLGILGENADSG